MDKVYQVPQKFRDKHEEQNFWLKAITDQIASNVGAEKFCQKHQINFSTFTYWKYKKKEFSSKINNDIIKAKNKQSDKDVARFIALQVADDVQSKEKDINAQDKKTEIVFKNGHKMILSSATFETNLLLLVKVIGGL